MVLTYLYRKEAVRLRLCVPCTPSEIASCCDLSLPQVRAYLYQLREQGKAVRLDTRVPKANKSGRQWESLWSAA